MNTKFNLNIALNIGAVSAAATIPSAGLYLFATDSRARTYTAIYAGVLGVIITVAAIWLARWNLSRGGSTGLGPLNYAGKGLARPRSPRPASSRRTAASSPTVHRPAQARTQSPDGAGGAVIFLIVVAVVIAWALVGPGQSASGGTTKARDAAAATAPSTMVIYQYYAAVNEREWPKAWKLTGQSAPVDSPAYNRWVNGYACTVRDQITSIAQHGGGALLVTVRAQESGGIIQTYHFSYVVKSGVLTQAHMVSLTGRAPRGCSK